MVFRIPKTPLVSLQRISGTPQLINHTFKKNGFIFMKKKIVGFCSKNNNTFFLPSISFTILFIFKGNSYIKTRFWSTVIIHWLLSSNRLSRLFPIIFLLVNFQYNQNCFVSFLVLSTTLFPIPFSLIFSITNCFLLYAALVTISIALSL